MSLDEAEVVRRAGYYPCLRFTDGNGKELTITKYKKEFRIFFKDTKSEDYENCMTLQHAELVLDSLHDQASEVKFTAKYLFMIDQPSWQRQKSTITFNTTERFHQEIVEKLENYRPKVLNEQEMHEEYMRTQREHRLWELQRGPGMAK